MQKNGIRFAALLHCAFWEILVINSIAEEPLVDEKRVRCINSLYIDKKRIQIPYSHLYCAVWESQVL